MPQSKIHPAKLRTNTIVTLSALVAAVSLAGTAFAVPPANDPCASAMPIAGAGGFAFDLTEATFDGTGAFAPQCDIDGAHIDHDIWYCWTSTCNGLVEFSTCGTTQVDTKIRIYQGCTCPSDVADPICCSDDDCGKQTRVICDAVCGQTYLIQLGTKAGAPGGPGTLNITCLEETCGGGGEPPAIVCGCCGTRPPLVNTISTPFNPGAVAAGTNYRTNPNEPAFYLLDLGNQGTAPIGTNTSWPTNRYADASWSMHNLGSVFGVTFNDVGDIFVAHTAVYGDYGDDVLGALGAAGSIYRIDGTFGVPGEFIRLPNQLDSSLPLNQQYPGLGQVDFDCSNGRLFASNFDDGRIYSIDSTGAIKSTFDHATGTVTGPLSGANIPEAGDPKGFEPLGKRVWAVRGTGGRLYYSTWAEDSGRPSPSMDNEIWSVQLNASGDFVAGTAQLEITMPPLAVGDDFSNPVADIDFDDNCCMLVAERGMNDDTRTTPHQGRVLRFCYDAAAGWALDPTQFSIGFAGTHNSVGGVGWEGAPNSLVWGLGDAISTMPGNQIYGLSGIPTTGGDLTNSILLDLDGDLSFQQKDELGSLELTCAEAPCATVVDGEILCEADGTFEYTFTITNTSGQTIAAIILPDPNMSPNVVPLNPPLANGGSITLTTTITGQQAGGEYCFEMIFGSVEGNQCCHIDHCVQLPDCECAQTSHVSVQATTTPGVFNVTFSITNLEAWGMGHVSLFPAGTTGSLSPSLWNFGAVPQYGTQVIGPITINSGMSPGDEFCITIGQHSANWLQCCFIELCVEVPNPAPSCHPADLNCDGSIDAADLAILLGAWGSSGPGDLNADGQVNASDLAILLGAWGS